MRLLKSNVYVENRNEFTAHIMMARKEALENGKT